MQKKLTINSALDKYFFPLRDKLAKSRLKIDNIIISTCKNISNKKPAKKHRVLKFILKVVLAFGMGYGLDLLLAPLLVSISVGFQLIAFGGLCVASFGILQAIHSISSHIFNESKKKKQLEAVKQFGESAKLDVKFLANIINLVETLKDVSIDDEKFCVTTKTNLATLNRNIFSFINRVYAGNLSSELKKVISPYLTDLSACYTNVPAINNDLNNLKTQLKNISCAQLNIPNLIAKEDNNVIQSLREKLQKIIPSTIIPFVQVVNVKTQKTIDSFETELERQKQKELKEKAEALKKENKEYQEFFEEYGIDESLIQ